MDKFLPKDLVTVSKGTKPKKITAKKGAWLKVSRSQNYIEVTTNDLDLIKQLKKDGYSE